MSDSLLTYVIIFAGIGILLLLLLLVFSIYLFKKNKNEGRTTQELIRHIKKLVLVERDNPESSPETKKEVELELLMADERQLYQHLIKFSINKDTRLLKSTTAGIHSLIGSYIELLSVQSEARGSAAETPETPETSETSETSEKVGDGITSSAMKKENESLRSEVSVLEEKLKKATGTIEGMMEEFSSMYEGGHDEGEERTEKEMKKINRKINEE